MTTGGSTGGSSGRDPWLPRASAAGDTVVVPGYRDLVSIARSDHSEVFRAHQVALDRPVAIKVLRVVDEEGIARFQREITITSQLGRQHPHIVNVIETAMTTTGQPCVVMDFYDLGSLYDRLRARGPLPWGEVLAVGEAVADALAFAHLRGVLHRDVKPQNILALPTSYVVADFGISRPIDATFTSSAEWFSYRYASPQVLEGERPSVADDVFSLGATLYTLLAGRPPFAGDDEPDVTALAYMRRVRTEAPRPLSRPDVPPELLAIVYRCLRRDPAERFPDARALREAMSELDAQLRAWAPGRASQPAAAPAVVVASPRPPVTAPQATGPSASLPPPACDATGMTLPGVASPTSMARLLASDIAAGGYATGRAPAGGYGAGDGTGRGGDDRVGILPTAPTPARRGRFARSHAPRIVVLAVAASLLGVLLVVGTGYVFRLASDGHSVPPPGGGAPVGSAGPAAGSLDGGQSGGPGAAPAPMPSAAVNNPAIAPVLTRAQQQGDSVLLDWRDNSDGTAQFIVVRVVDGQGQPLGPLDPGTVHFTAQHLAPASGPYCFVVLAVEHTFGGYQVGTSGERCTP